MALQHLRSSTANKRPVPGNMSEGQLGINTNDASPGLFFKDSNNALVKVGPVHVGTTAPNASPASGGTAGNSVGEQWLDTSGGTYVFKVWDGSAWRSESGTFVDVNGDVMTGALGIIAGSASAPGLYFSGDANTGLYSPGADQLAIATGGTGRVFVSSLGRVGFGTAAPDTNIHVFSPNPEIQLQSSGANTTCEYSMLGRDSSDVAHKVNIKTSGSYLTFGTGGNTSNGFAAVARMQIDSSGNVLIGGTSAAPNFQVKYDGGIVANTNGLVYDATSKRLGLGTSTPQAAFESKTANVQPGDAAYAKKAVIANIPYSTSNITSSAIAVYDGTLHAADIGYSYDGTGYYLTFGTSVNTTSTPTERLRVTSTGQVRLAGAGITFNGDTATANELDDYEEGTFTPTIVGTTSAGSGTYTNQIGRYTKIGDRVTFTIYLNWTAHTGTGNIRISNLPFTSTSATGSFHAVSIYADGIPFTGPWIQAYVGVNSTNIGMGQMTAAGVVSGIPMDSAGDITITGHYEV